MTTRNLPFHDGHLLGIRMGERTATLSLREIGGTEHELTLDGVELLRMDDFRQGNIVDLIEIVSGERPSPDVPLDRLFGSPHPSAGEEYQAQHAAFVERHLADIESGSASLVTLISSYGADLIAFCRKVTLRDV